MYIDYRAIFCVGRPFNAPIDRCAFLLFINRPTAQQRRHHRLELLQKCPDKTEEHVSDEDSVAETGRREV